MEKSIAEELYSESLQVSKQQLADSSAAITGSDEAHVHTNDGSWCDSDEEWDEEWHRTQNQFHTMGYRDGLIAGKEAAAQEGFNDGFKKSVLVGYNWGLVRGVTSALACLPDGLRETLIENQEKRSKLQELHKSVQSISTTDALKLFYDDIKTKEAVEQSETPEQSSNPDPLGNHFAELLSLLESSDIKVQSAVDK